MKRRIALLICTCVVLVAAYMGYRHIVGDGDIFEHRNQTADQGQPSSRPSGNGAITPGGPNANSGVDWRVEGRDKDGRLTGIYKAADWQRNRDGSLTVNKPIITLYQQEGQQTTVTAERGEIYGEQLGRSFEVRSGKLIGSVMIDIDRGTETNRPPLDDRPLDRVRITMDEVTYRAEDLEIHSASDVKVTAAEADIEGRGLTIIWHEKPRELQELRLDQGRRIIVKNMPEEMDMIALPGSAHSQGQPDKPIVSSPEVPVAKRDLTAVPPAGKSRNVYQAIFSGGPGGINVKTIGDAAVKAGRSMTGAKELTLSFDMERAKDERKSRQPKAPVTNGPASPATTRPATGQMEIAWQGPLVLKPTGYTAAPSKKNYALKATGDRITLADSKTTALCREFEFLSAQQSGYILGGSQEREWAQLGMAKGESVRCERMEFDRPKGQAKLIGPGELRRPSSDRNIVMNDKPAATASSRPIPQGAVDVITWKGWVDAEFDEIKVAGIDGKEETKTFMKTATFHKNVAMAEGVDGGYIRCKDRLVTIMQRGQLGEPFPTQFEAYGDVDAKLDQSTIKAPDRIKVTFKDDVEDRNGKLTQVVKPQMLYAYGTPDVFVTVVDDSKPNEVVTATAHTIESNVAVREATLLGHKDKPARITQGSNNSIEGPKVVAAFEEQSVRVFGAGKMRFLSKTDLEGNDLAASQPVDIDWSQAMDADMKKNLVHFVGSDLKPVKLSTQMDSMVCPELRLWLVEGPATAPADIAPQKKPRDGKRIALSMDDFSKRKLKMLKSDGNVEMDSRRLDANGKLTQQMRLVGSDLVYDVVGKKIDLLGAGKMFMADYRAPKEPATQDAGPAAAGNTKSKGMLGGSGQRPSQTVIAWTQSLEWWQKDRKILLTGVSNKGGVDLIHQSGTKLINAEQIRRKLNVPTWPEKLPDGEVMKLHCLSMEATFGQAATKPADSAELAAPSGSAKSTGNSAGLGNMMDMTVSLDNLIRFEAMREVNIQANAFNVNAAKVTWNKMIDIREGGTADIWGSLPGEKPMKAALRYEDANSTPVDEHMPYIHCEIREGRPIKVATSNITGTGNR